MHVCFLEAIGSAASVSEFLSIGEVVDTILAWWSNFYAALWVILKFIDVHQHVYLIIQAQYNVWGKAGVA